jgi:thioredoxin reductase (NADPH)
MWDSVITEIVGEEAVKSVKIKNVKTNEQSEMAADGVFIFIGHIPNTQFFSEALELDERGYIKTDHRRMTNVTGVFVAGEAGDPDFRQVVTSAGMGAAAAMQAIRFLEKNEEHQPEAVKS